MTADSAAPRGAGLVDRIKNILFTPQAEWERIAGEPADAGKLYGGYVLPLAALSAVCAFIGTSIVGVFGMRIGMVPGLIGAAMQVVGAVLGIFLMALVINALAPTFGSRQDMGQAQKLAAYSATAGLLAGVFAIIPALAILGLLGLYSLVLLFVGLPRMMGTPSDKRLGYFLTIIVVCIVASIVFGMVLSSVRALVPGLGMPAITFGGNAPRTTTEGQVTLPGGGAIDLGEVQKQVEAIESGVAPQAVDPSRLQAMLPQSLAGFALASQSSGSAMGMTQAEGVYQNGDASLTVTIVHMGAMGAMAGMAAGANVQQNRQDADGYASTRTVDGRIYSEEVSNSAGSANYTVIGRGVSVAAQGSGGVTIEQARAAVEAVGVERLERALAN